MTCSLKTQEVGPVTVVTFEAQNILDELDAEEAGEQLNALLRRGGPPNLLLDFGPLERMTSSMVARLLNLAAAVRAAGGRIAMCRVSPFLRDVFALLGVTRVIPMYTTEEEALEDFQEASTPAEACLAAS
jgi:stage II sporulation protein AA (anti-sigma F factor antagonist)